jgi:thiol:disulfide interchange protein DsbD
MNAAVTDLGYRPRVVQSRLGLEAATTNAAGPIPEPVATAVRRAGETGRLVFVEFFAEWCGACREMDRTTFQDPSFKAVLADLHFVKVDTDIHLDAARYFGIVGMPTLTVLNAQGEALYRHVGPIDADSLVRDLAKLPLGEIQLIPSRFHR